MPEVNEISFTIEGHCIETAARLELAQLIREAIESDDNIDLINMKIEFLQEFITSTDFRRLRTLEPALDGRVRCNVIIKRVRGSSFEVQILDCP